MTITQHEAEIKDVVSACSRGVLQTPASVFIHRLPRNDSGSGEDFSSSPCPSQIVSVPRARSLAGTAGGV